MRGMSKVREKSDIVVLSLSRSCNSERIPDKPNQLKPGRTARLAAVPVNQAFRCAPVLREGHHSAGTCVKYVRDGEKVETWSIQRLKWRTSDFSRTLLIPRVRPPATHRKTRRDWS